jgi:membrane protein implicated in regulation of membrane protease activity
LLAVSLFVIGVILIIIEMFTLTFVLLWIGIASIIASIVEYFNHSFFLTFGTFFISAIVLWLCTKRFAKRVSSSKSIKNGVFALVGKEIVVTTVSDQDTTAGTSKVYGDEWPIKANHSIRVNEKVKVLRVEGATLYVE